LAEALNLEILDLEVSNFEVLDLEVLDLEVLDLEALDLEASDLEALAFETLDSEILVFFVVARGGTDLAAGRAFLARMGAAGSDFGFNFDRSLRVIFDMIRVY
jgi:hypothetical protein